MLTSGWSGVWLGLAAAGLMASTAGASVVSSEFYTRAGTSVSDAAFGLVNTDTGPTGSSSASSVNPLTSVDYCASDCVSTGDASASANLVSASLHARGGNTGNAPGSNGFGAASRASFGDTINFSNPSATASTLTTIGFVVHVHGVESVTFPYDGDSRTFGRLSLSFGFAASPSDWGASPPVPGNVSPDFFFQQTWAHSVGGVTDTTIDQDIVGSIGFTGPTASVPLQMILDTNAQFGYSNFGDTAAFRFEPLPPGVTYSSTSGVFLTAVPEPYSAAILVKALAGLAALGRRGRSRS